MNCQIIDIHTHIADPPDSRSGGTWSKEFIRTPAFVVLKLITGNLFGKITSNKIRNHMIKVISNSKSVDAAVLLALDQVYDLQGTVCRNHTHLYVPNEYVADLAKNNRKILFGASIHPYRKDWEKELDSCLEKNAVLCKWLPSSQMIDPSHPVCIPFYKKLAQYRLPLLCHGGAEHVIPTSDRSYLEFNNPKYLRQALDAGVTVIVAHCALPYFWILDSENQDDFRDFLQLIKEAEMNNWKLYSDLAALLTPTRVPYMDTILNEIPHDRLILGSDYPIPLFEFMRRGSNGFLERLKFQWRVFRTKNPLDKNMILLRNMGFSESVFTNACKLFADIQYPERRFQ